MEHLMESPCQEFLQEAMFGNLNNIAGKLNSIIEKVSDKQIPAIMKSLKKNTVKLENHAKKIGMNVSRLKMAGSNMKGGTTKSDAKNIIALAIKESGLSKGELKEVKQARTPGILDTVDGGVMDKVFAFFLALYIIIATLSILAYGGNAIPTSVIIPVYLLSYFIANSLSIIVEKDAFMSMAVGIFIGSLAIAGMFGGASVMFITIAGLISAVLILLPEYQYPDEGEKRDSEKIGGVVVSGVIVLFILVRSLISSL